MVNMLFKKVLGENEKCVFYFYLKHWRHFLAHPKSRYSYLKTVWKFLKKLKIELSYNPAIPFLGIYLKKTETVIWKDISTPIFIKALFTIAKIWKQPVSTAWWMDKEDVVYTLNGILFSCKKDEILPVAATWIDLEGIMLSEIRQRKTNTIWFHLYMKSKEEKQAKQKQTHRYREQTGGCHKGEGLGDEWNRWRGLRGTNFQL